MNVPRRSSGGIVAALPRLSVLDVSCNPQLSPQVDVGGFRDLGVALSYSAALTTLRLQACGLTTDCLDVLGRRIYCNCLIMFLLVRVQKYFHILVMNFPSVRQHMFKSLMQFYGSNLNK